MIPRRSRLTESELDDRIMRLVEAGDKITAIELLKSRRGLSATEARRFVDEAGCDAVKLEGAGRMLSRVRAIIAAGIPVIGHVGLLPQSVVTPDGYRAQGRGADDALRIIADGVALEQEGCAALIVEAVPAAVASLLT